MTRKYYFVLAVVSSAVSHLYFRPASEGPLGFLFHCLFAAYMMPGNALCILLEHVISLPFHGYIAITSLVSSLVWLFPPRIARWFGTFDAFKEGPRRRPLLVHGAASALDAINKRLFGRQKTGGWA